MSVSGTLESPCIGILNNELEGQELLDCPLHVPLVNRTLSAIRGLIAEFKLVPYDISARRGELKGLIVRASAAGDSVTARFVLRSTEAVPRVRKAAAKLAEEIPELDTVTANIQPVPHAILEGPEEIVLAGTGLLWERYGEVELAFSPQSFSQVSPETAAALYGHVTARIAKTRPEKLLDLYCGVGGFSIFAANHCGRVTGVELAPQAIDCARRGAEKNGRTNIEFHAEPVGEFLRRTALGPDAIVCNPPRRGLLREVTTELERLAPERIWYSSCNPETLFDDLDALASYEPLSFAPFEMFPLTEHIEVVCELVKRVSGRTDDGK